MNIKYTESTKIVGLNFLIIRRPIYGNVDFQRRTLPSIFFLPFSYIILHPTVEQFLTGELITQVCPFDKRLFNSRVACAPHNWPIIPSYYCIASLTRTTIRIHRDVKLNPRQRMEHSLRSSQQNKDPARGFEIRIS